MKNKTCYFIPNDIVQTCWTCKGSKYVDKKHCKTCKGTGIWIEKRYFIVVKQGRKKPYCFDCDTIK